jgi:hypothetical protein
MTSSRDCLDLSGDDLNGGGNEQGGDNGYKDCFAHGRPPSVPSTVRADSRGFDVIVVTKFHFLAVPHIFLSA